MALIRIPRHLLLRVIPHALQAGYSLSDINTLLCSPKTPGYLTLSHIEASPSIASLTPSDLQNHSLTLHGNLVYSDSPELRPSPQVSWQSSTTHLNADLHVPLTHETFKLLSLAPIPPLTLQHPSNAKTSPFVLKSPLIPQTEYLPQPTALSTLQLMELLYYYCDFPLLPPGQFLPCLQQISLCVETTTSYDASESPEQFPCAPPILVNVTLSTPNTPISESLDLGTLDIQPGLHSYNAHTALYAAACNLLRIYLLSHVLPSLSPNLAVGVHTSYDIPMQWKPLPHNSPEYFHAITSRISQSFLYDTNNPPSSHSQENDPLKVPLRSVLPPWKALKTSATPLQDCLQHVRNLSTTHFPSPFIC